MLSSLFLIIIDMIFFFFTLHFVCLVFMSVFVCFPFRVDYLSQKLLSVEEADRQLIREQIDSLEREINLLRLAGYQFWTSVFLQGQMCPYLYQKWELSHYQVTSESCRSPTNSLRSMLAQLTNTLNLKIIWEASSALSWSQWFTRMF